MSVNELKKILLNGKKLYLEPIEIESIFPLYNNLIESFAQNEVRLNPPELIVYSSYNKEVLTKHMSSDNGEISASYLLFDTHLLEILGEFTEAFLSVHYADLLSHKLVFKLFAEDMYVSDKLHEALHFAYQYRASKSVVALSQERLTVMARHLLIQEAFVLSHEICHWYFFRCNEVERNKHLEYKRDLWIQYLDILLEKRRHKGDVKGITMLSEMKQYVKVNDDIVEEVTCDTFAAIYLTEYYSGVEDYSKVDIAVSSFLCIQNMQLLSFIAHDLVNGTKKISTSDHLMFKITLRMILFKHHIQVYFDNYEKEIVQQFNEEINRCKEIYNERVLSPFIVGIDQAKIESAQLSLLSRVTFLDDDYCVIGKLIRDLLEEQ